MTEVSTSWRRASGCDAGQCVEVDASPGLDGAICYRMRAVPGDTTVLRFDADAWARLVADLKGDGLHEGSVLCVESSPSLTDVSGWIRVWRPQDPEYWTTVSSDEWVVFVAGVRAGEFDG